MGCWSRSRSGLLLALALACAPACTNSTDAPDGGSAGRGSEDAAVPPQTHDAAHADGGDAGGAGDASIPAPAECDVVAPTSCPSPAPTFADVEPIFNARCVECHAGMPGGPWALTSYEHVSAWVGEIRGAMRTCAMPPPDSGIEMPNEEREKILSWIFCGFRR